MKFSPLIFGLALSGMLAAACAPIATRSTMRAEMTSATPTCDSAQIKNGNDFVSQKVFLLSTMYHPEQGAAPASSDIIRNVLPTDPYWNDLSAAFNIAPEIFREKLCGLTKVFIVECAKSVCTLDEAVDNSWGLREWQGGSGEFIATSAVLWQHGTSALPFNEYRRQKLRLLMTKVSNSNLSNWTKFPTYSPAKPNNKGEMTVLAALAHEVGHVLWYDEFVPDRGKDNIDLDRFCGGFYRNNAWSNIRIPPDRWLSFAQQNADIRHNPDYISAIQGDLLSGTHRPDFVAAGKHLYALLQDPGLASALAAVSPDEEFVETYELYVLLRSTLNGVRQLKDLSLTIYGDGTDLMKENAPIDFQRKYSLLTKMSCFGQLP